MQWWGWGTSETVPVEYCVACCIQCVGTWSTKSFQCQFSILFCAKYVMGCLIKYFVDDWSKLVPTIQSNGVSNVHFAVSHIPPNRFPWAMLPLLSQQVIHGYGTKLHGCVATGGKLVVSTPKEPASNHLAHCQPVFNQSERPALVPITSALEKAVDAVVLTLGCSKLPSWCSTLVIITSGALGAWASEFVYEAAEPSAMQDCAQDKFEAERQRFIQEIASLKRENAEIQRQFDEHKKSIHRVGQRESPSGVTYTQSSVLLEPPVALSAGSRHHPSTDLSMQLQPTSPPAASNLLAFNSSRPFVVPTMQLAPTRPIYWPESWPATSANKHGYIVGSKNTNSCPAGSQSVSSSLACSAAALDSSWVWKGHKTDSSSPKGCFAIALASGATGLYYNKHSVGSAQQQSAPVCRAGTHSVLHARTHVHVCMHACTVNLSIYLFISSLRLALNTQVHPQIGFANAK